jgi:hypothetical protein
MIFRFFPEPIIPCKAVAHDEATQDIVRAEYTDYAQGKEREGYAECKERLVIDKPGVRFSPGSRVWRQARGWKGQRVERPEGGKARGWTGQRESRSR